MENPYFDLVAPAVSVGRNRTKRTQTARKIVEYRRVFVDVFAYAVPNAAAIETVVAHSPIIEIGAGSGYWARLVMEAGGTVAACDVDPPPAKWAPVVEMDGIAFLDALADVHEDAALLLCWPPPCSEMADRALRAYDGETVVYVGEGRGGCTADEAFHERLHGEFELVETVAIPTYMGMRDRLEVWERDL